MFVKTADKDRIEAQLEAEAAADIKVKVISVDTLRTDYRQFKDRRDLLASFDIFLADDRILTVLPSLLGKTFFARKKQPLPVSMKAKNLSSCIRKARDSTFMFLGKLSMYWLYLRFV